MRRRKGQARVISPQLIPPRLPLDAVSTDTTGPINPPDPDGNRYLQLIVEAATGHTQGALMKRKSEASEAILAAIMRLQLALGGPSSATTRTTPRSSSLPRSLTFSASKAQPSPPLPPTPPSKTR